MIEAIRPSFGQVQREVTAYALALAVLVDECVELGAGKRMLGLAEEDSLNDVIDQFDPNRIRMARHLDVYYEYAYDARVPAGHEGTIDPYSSPAEHLRDFAQMFGPDASYFDLCLDVIGIDIDTDTGFLKDMISLWEARHNLDHGSELHVAEIALLAEMNERSVRNAASLEGSTRLAIQADQTVANAEARRWLAGRRGFRPTEFRDLPADADGANEQLSAAEIPVFVARQLFARSGGTALDKLVLDSILDGTYELAIPDYVEEAARAVNLAPKILARAMRSPLQIAPGDCESVAHAIGADPVWFTLQVMQALFPKPMEMILNPTAFRNEETPALPAGSTEIEIVLSAAMIQHGYLDFPASAKTLFPDDCFGTRSTGDQGAPLELRYGGQTVQTDMRFKSERVISPRKRFSGWLKTQTKARAGDRVRLTRIGERSFDLSFVPAVRSH